MWNLICSRCSKGEISCNDFSFEITHVELGLNCKHRMKRLLIVSFIWGTRQLVQLFGIGETRLDVQCHWSSSHANSSNYITCDVAKLPLLFSGDVCCFPSGMSPNCLGRALNIPAHLRGITAILWFGLRGLVYTSPYNTLLYLSLSLFSDFQ